MLESTIASSTKQITDLYATSSLSLHDRIPLPAMLAVCKMLAAPAQANASRQKRTHLATSATALEPRGTGYSSSMSAGNVHFSFFISWRISFSGV